MVKKFANERFDDSLKQPEIGSVVWVIIKNIKEEVGRRQKLSLIQLIKNVNKIVFNVRCHCTIFRD